MNMTESTAICGRLDYTLYRKGHPPRRFFEQNMIMNSAKATLAKLIAGEGAGAAITRIGFGIDANGPTPDDKALTAAYIKTLDGHSFPAPGQVTFAFSLAESEANGKTIRELGLICADSALFSRKVRGAIEKTADLSLTGTWTIIF
ncbi:MAG: hypothetical protein ACRCYV_03670 [Aeromonas sp.]